MKMKKFTITVAGLLILIFTFNILFIKSDFFYNLRSYVPENAKNFLRKTIFVYPQLKKDFADLQRLKTHNLILISNEYAVQALSNFDDNEKYHITIEKKNNINNLRIFKDGSISQIMQKFDNTPDIERIFDKKIISSKNNKYDLNIKYLPFSSRAKGVRKAKAGGYIDIFNENLIIANTYGDFYFSNLDHTDNSKIKMTRIPTNFKDINKSKIFKNQSQSSINDILIQNNEIFLSYSGEITNDDYCYGIHILRGKMNLEYIEFESFWQFDNNQCSRGDVSHGGGRMKIKGDQLILTTGDYGESENRNGISRAVSQDLNSYMGKVLSINLNSKSVNILSAGHRNPQGLYIIDNSDTFLTTEHGPLGGDEINVHKFRKESDNIPNYGWPIASYGKHYDGKKRAVSPLHKSHSKYGFIEPIKYYVPSIAISEIIRVNNEFDEKFSNDLFVAALGENQKEGDLSIHHLKLNEDFSKILFEDTIFIDNRIRDMFQYKDTVILYLENIAAIAVLRIKK